MPETLVTIAGRPIGPSHLPYIVAELSGNHNGDLDRAFALMKAAKAAGADAIKIQTYTADTITIDCDRPEFRIESGLWKGRTLHDLYGEAHTPWDWHDKLFDMGRNLGIPVFSTPFDFTAVDLLEQLGAPAYKIASFEVVDLPLIERCAKTGKPLVISTGMADLAEIAEAMGAANKAGASEVVLLHCVSGYPTPPQDINLRTMPHLAEAFSAVGGLSDHTLGTAVSVAAVALGACFIEKHVTLQRSDGGPDAAFSLEPDELGELVRSCRDAWLSLGQVNYARKASEADNLTFRRSLFAVTDIRAGEMFTSDNVRSIRPGHGLAPKFLPQVLGRHAARDIAKGEPIDWALLN